MDPIRNPYAPGAGTRPPEMAGRDETREKARVALERIRAGRSSRSLIMIGLRGVGKTVLLDRMREDAEMNGILALPIEASENRSLPAIIVPRLRAALRKLSRREAVVELARRDIGALENFAAAHKVKYEDIEVNLDFDSESGLANSGDLESDLAELMEAVGEAAKSAETCIVLMVDELQYVKENELAALIAALHRTAQRGLPITMVGAGLPQLRGRLGKAKTYAERLFEFPEIGALSHEDAKRAIAKPARAEGVEIEDRALNDIVESAAGYPYFLQVWGKHVWDIAERSPITLSDVRIASEHAADDLDESFFRVRFDRLTPRERVYLRAMASLGQGPHRSGEIAKAMGRHVRSLAPMRSSLINKGMIWSPRHGDTAFTVPMFDGFMRRIMPGDDRSR